jgi:hypothetical protein
MRHISHGLENLETKIRTIIEYIVLWPSWSWISIAAVSTGSPVLVSVADIATVFLTNTSPARCHIHTVNRLPNRGDYGKALLEQRGLPS